MTIERSKSRKKVFYEYRDQITDVHSTVLFKIPSQSAHLCISVFVSEGRRRRRMAAAAQRVARRVGTMSMNMSSRLRVPPITGEKIVSSHTTVTIPVPLLHSSCLPSTVTGSLEEWSSPVLCGRGDRKTKKGKRFRGTYGKARPKKDKMIERFKEKVEVPPSTPWPLPFKII